VKKADIFDLHADLCRTLANPKRLQLLALLAKAEMSVGELAGVLDVPLSNVSQHLALLRAQGLVASRKAGQTVHYSLADRRIIQACTLIRSVLLDRMKERGQIARETDPRYVVVAG
jgi:ArsR family transcriptional regulator, virulence genes transcriptional regulator